MTQDVVPRQLTIPGEGEVVSDERYGPPPVRSELIWLRNFFVWSSVVLFTVWVLLCFLLGAAGAWG